MENATKALLIAAAVLIVILIIALGMRIFNSTSGATSSATGTGKAIDNQTEIATSIATESITGVTSKYMGEETAEKFNDKFNSLIGDDKTGTEAITLANKIISNNKTSEHYIHFTVYINEHYQGQSISTTVGTSQDAVKNCLKTEKMYDISASYDGNGYVKLISFKVK